MASEKLEEIDWVTFGVILKKITPQSSNSVSHFIDFSAVSSQIDSGDSSQMKYPSVFHFEVIANKFPSCHTIVGLVPEGEMCKEGPT